MKNRILLLCDYAAYHRIDIGFLFLALIGSVLIALGRPYGWPVAICCLAAFICVGAFGDGSAHPKYNLHQRVARDLAQAFQLQSIEGELLPPWLEAPGVAPFHMFWRMGGEYYIANFFSFFRELGRSEQEAYFARYDLGDAWPHRDQWHRLLFDLSDIQDA